MQLKDDRRSTEKVNSCEMIKHLWKNLFANSHEEDCGNGDEGRRDKGKGKSPNDEFYPSQFYSEEFVCAADCLSSSDRSNESELKRSIKNVNSPNWDVKWRITASENGRDPTNRSRLSLIARETNPRLDTFTELKARSW